MKNILLPTDFSENAWNAILYTLHLYKNESCKFILLNSYQINGYHKGSKLIPIPGYEDLEKAKKNSEHGLQRLIEVIKKGYPNSNQHFFAVSHNYPLVEAIEHELEQNDIEVIVIGTKGSTGAYEVIYGSNTIKIMDEVESCPILAVPSNVPFFELKEIVLASSFKISHNEKDFQYVKKLALQTNTRICVLHIEEEGGLSISQKQNKHILKSYLEGVQLSFHSLAHVSVPIGIYCFIESRGSDMIAFVNKKHSFFEKLLYNPLYKDLGTYSIIPVLVLQPTAK
jgi:nucleotide-binding universal stress UspA family protein